MNRIIPKQTWWQKLVYRVRRPFLPKVSIKGDYVTVEPFVLLGPPKIKFGDAFKKSDIRHRLKTGNVGSGATYRYRPLERMQDRFPKPTGQPKMLGVGGRGTPPTRAEAHDPRWKVTTTESGHPQRVIGIVGIPNQSPRIMWEPYTIEWGVPTKEQLMSSVEQWPVGWLKDGEREGCFPEGWRQPNDWVGYWFDEENQRLVEVYDPQEFYKLGRF